MKMEKVREIASAVLYEGYLLYPYRHSAIKNRQRWTFGVVYPREYSEANGNLEPWSMHTECLLTGQPTTTLDITVNFLHLLKRSVTQPVSARTQEPNKETEQRLLLAGQLAYEPWEEGLEREVSALNLPLREVLARPKRIGISFSSGHMTEHSANAQDAEIVREQQALSGAVTIAAERVPDRQNAHLYRLSVHIENTTSASSAEQERRDAILLQAFISTHTILRVYEGNFISLLETPDELQAAAQDCKNVRTWPVLVGEQGERDTMLSSPIILYDYPQIAPESPGALFDGTEIDEILTLRILTLSDEEKEELRRGDPRVRELLERTEALTPEQFMQLHGTIRKLQASEHERPAQAVNAPTASFQPYSSEDYVLPARFQQYPGEDYPPPALVMLGDKEARVGDSVRLHPKGRADIFDMLLDGKTARIEAIQQDFENRLHIVVTVDDDPGREQWDERVLPGHRFFFSPAEVELL